MIPKFLEGNYPIVPFAIFLVVGAEFRGYHVRFRDIARGGIRIIRSGNLQAFTQNVTTLFDENYNLAATQDRKNKDIPEGGSKRKFPANFFFDISTKHFISRYFHFNKF